MQGHRFRKHKWWFLTVVLTLPVVAVAAGVPHAFQSGTLISSAQMNENFKAVTDRLDAIEASLQRRTTAKVVMENVPGPLNDGKSATFTSSGGDLLIMVSGTGWAMPVSYAVFLNVSLDGKALGNIETFHNDSNHAPFPTRLFAASGLAAGSHVITLANGSPQTVTDTIDFFTVTVVETFH